MEPYLIYLTVFVGVMAAASVIEAIVLIVVCRRVTKLADEVEKAVARLSDQSKVIMEQVVVLMDEINKQASRYGQVGHQISSRVQQKINGLLDGVERIGTMTTSGAAAVVREASAAMHGLLAALTYFGRRTKRKALPPPEEENLAVH
jgi:uncharacterized protein YoxC